MYFILFYCYFFSLYLQRDWSLILIIKKFHMNMNCNTTVLMINKSNQKAIFLCLSSSNMMGG